MDLKQFNEVAASVGAEFLATGLEPHQFFMWAIHKQNTMYELPVSATPGFSALGEAVTKRLQGFLNTLNKEIQEGYEILELARLLESGPIGEEDQRLVNRNSMAAALVTQGCAQELAQKLADSFHDYSETVLTDDIYHDQTYRDALEMFIMVGMADWHADIAVYNRSESLKYGIPLESVQNVVMNSNFTKLGADGLPIKNADGKFLKGPNFIPPEAHIHALMYEADIIADEAQEVLAQASVVEGVTMPLLVNPMDDVFAAVDADDDEDYDLGDEDDSPTEGDEDAGDAE